MDMPIETVPMVSTPSIASERGSGAPIAAPSTISIAWIDQAQLSRESLITAIASGNPHFAIHPFASIESCRGHQDLEADLMLFYCHSEDHVDLAGIQALRDGFPTTPLIVMSDAAICDPQSVRETLARGVAGFILTRRTSLQVVASAINLVHSGGTFVPRDFLFTDAPPSAAANRHKKDTRQLTQRERAVLEWIRLGKPNKIIAENLGMSASTVKVHVRNIMQKMRVANRTQVALSAAQFAGE